MAILRVMSEEPENRLFGKERRAEQMRQELTRAPKRFRWRVRRVLQGISNSLGVAFYLSFIPLAGWMIGMPWPGQFTEWLLGWSFFPAWLVFGILTPCVWFAAMTGLFKRWFNEEEVSFIGSDASAEQIEKEAAWTAEDVADDKRWEQRAATAGSMALADGDIAAGQLSELQQGELALDERATEEASEA